jgi:hypothetical protein
VLRAQPPRLRYEHPAIERQLKSGHHAKTIESLELTINADSKMIQKMRIFSKKRNITSYDSAGNVSKQELELAIPLVAPDGAPKPEFLDAAGRIVTALPPNKM